MENQHGLYIMAVEVRIEMDLDVAEEEAVDP